MRPSPGHRDLGRPARHHIQVAFDRETGLIVRLVETIGAATTLEATVVDLAPDASLQPSTFDYAFPTGTTLIY